MQRVTVTVDDALAELARADVAAGREASLSAWVADAMRRKALSRAELVTELEQMTAARPYDAETVAWVADALGRSTGWVADRLPAPTRTPRRAR